MFIHDPNQYLVQTKVFIGEVRVLEILFRTFFQIKIKEY